MKLTVEVTSTPAEKSKPNGKRLYICVQNIISRPNHCVLRLMNRFNLGPTLCLCKSCHSLPLMVSSASHSDYVPDRVGKKVFLVRKVPS